MKMELRLQQKGCVLWSLFGVFLTLIGVLLRVLNPVDHLVRDMIKLREGSMTHELFKKVPIEIFLNVYIFNITNSEKFLKGEDEKLALDQIGPYVFMETRENFNVTFYDNKTMSYVPNLKNRLVLERSVGNPFEDKIIVPNLPLLGLLTLISNEPSWKQMAVKSFLWSVSAKPFLEMTVNDFMWGYKDRMVRILAGYFPNWIDFNTFGVLDRLYAEKNSIVRMDLNESSDQLYSIQTYNGSPGLKEWGFVDLNTSLPCNTVKGSYEGLMFPPNLRSDTKLVVYKKQFCRTLPLKFVKEVDTGTGLRGFRYELPDDALSCSNPDNVCFCPKNGTCLPDGLSDLTPCYYGLPVAMSFPHFLGSDPKLSEKVTGLKPDAKKHMSFAIVQPDLGMPMKVSTRTQVNLVVNDISFMNTVKAFSNMIIPVLWMDGYVEGLPDDLVFKMVVAFKYLPIIQQWLAWCLIAVGLLLFVYKSAMYVLKTSDFKNVTHMQNLYMQVAMTEPNQKDEQLRTIKV